jgi:hypothetical protein
MPLESFASAIRPRRKKRTLWNGFWSKEQYKKTHYPRVTVEKDNSVFLRIFPKSWMEGREEFIKQLDWPIGYDTLFARGEGRSANRNGSGGEMEREDRTGAGYAMNFNASFMGLDYGFD